jgi:hypothetical protein
VNVLVDVLAHPSFDGNIDPFLIPISVAKEIGNDLVRIILEMLITPEGSLRVFCNPFSRPSFGVIVQSQINDMVATLLKT